MDRNNILKIKKTIVFRKETDEWALLFEPDTGETYALNPIGVIIWKSIDGKCTINDIIKIVNEKCIDVPSNSDSLIINFLKILMGNNLIQLI